MSQSLPTPDSGVLRWLWAWLRPACIHCGKVLGPVWRETPVRQRECSGCLLDLTRLAYLQAELHRTVTPTEFEDMKKRYGW